MRKIDYYIKQFNKDNELRKQEIIFYSKRRKRKINNKLRKVKKIELNALNMLDSKYLSIGDKIKKLRRLASKNYGISLRRKEYLKIRRSKNKLNCGTCIICGRKAYCMHHIIPVSKGGTNRKSNLIPICLECHQNIHPFMERDEEIKIDSIFDYLNTK